MENKGERVRQKRTQKDYSLPFILRVSTLDNKGGKDTNDIVSIAIGPLADTTKNLNKNNYDFLVNILEAGNTLVVTSASEVESDSLYSQAFETAHQDSL